MVKDTVLLEVSFYCCDKSSEPKATLVKKGLFYLTALRLILQVGD